MKKTAIRIVAPALVAMMILIGCTQSASKPGAAAEQPAAATFSAKSTDGRLEAKVVVAGKVAMVELKAADFDLNPTFASETPVDPVNKENEGHFIVQHNDNDPRYLAFLRTSLSDLEAGKHTLKVQMVNNDNSPIGVETRVEFDVK